MTGYAKQKTLTILGSTGSIGTQTLDIVRRFPGRFKVHGLVARSNWQLLARQAHEFRPAYIVIADPKAWQPLRDATAGLPTQVLCGDDAVADLAAMTEADLVVTAMVGYSGLLPTVRAIEAGRKIALANKETLVAGGELITRLLRESESEIIPVDSEHSAIFQCLVGEDRAKMRNILLTASGGPFRTLPIEQLQHVTAAQALKHPNWDMGAKVTIDSASMMNKGFEMIEARWLFDCEPRQIKILVHPQSIVHSMVEFCDGSVKAQLGVPDMHLPISYALGWPERLPSPDAPLSFADCSSLTFEQPDMKKFPLLALAFDAIEKGGNTPCALNAANEVAVDAFLHDRIKFTDMPSIAMQTMERTPYIKEVTLPALVDTHREATALAKSLISNFSL